MKKKITAIATKITAAVVAVTLLIFLGLEVFVRLYNPVETSLAVTRRHEELLTINGMIFRDESYVTYSDDRVLEYSVADGEKVSAGDSLALGYANRADADIGRRTEELKTQLETIKNNTVDNDYYVVDLDRIKDSILSSVYAISASSGEEGVVDIYGNVEALCGYITRKQAATGSNPDFSEKIAEIEDEIAGLDGSVSKKPDSVKAPSAGYFFSYCDGYEGSVDLENIKDMTVEDFNSIAPSEIPENAVGKIASSYEWYYVFTTERLTAQSFGEGKSVELRFPSAGAESFPATVKKVNYTGDEALVILSCNYMSEKYAVPRDSAVQVVTETTEGLYVDSRAVRIDENGNTGVYVLIGVEVKFRTLDIIYHSEDFVLADAETGNGDGLRLYDYIITKGNNLYDGKLIYRET